MEATKFSYAQLQVRWRALLEHPFGQADVADFFMGVHTDLPKGSFVRHVGEVMTAELNPDIPIQPFVLEKVSTWPQTTRIDGIMPLKVPVANDVVLPVYRFLDDIELVGFDRPELEREEQLLSELSLCLLAWFHQRPLQSNYGMMIELSTQCPSSAMAVKEDVALMGSLPNGSRVTVFYSSLKAETWAGVPASSLEHLAHLKAVRDASGQLVLAEDKPPERPQRLRW